MKRIRQEKLYCIYDVYPTRPSTDFNSTSRPYVLPTSTLNQTCFPRAAETLLKQAQLLDLITHTKTEILEKPKFLKVFSCGSHTADWSKINSRWSGQAYILDESTTRPGCIKVVYNQNNIFSSSVCGIPWRKPLNPTLMRRWLEW